MNRISQAVISLKKAGYNVKVNNCLTKVLVLDPVQCSNGLSKWTEYKEVAISVAKDLTGVIKFISARS